MSWTTTALEFFSNKTIRFSYKAALVFISFIILLGLDNIFNFSYSYRLNNKVNQIEKLNLIIKDSNSDSITKDFAVKTRKEVINKKIFTDYISDFFWKSSDKQYKRPDTNNAAKKEAIRPNLILYLLSQTGLFFLFGCFIGWLNFIADPKMKFAPKLAGAIAAFCSIYGIGIALSYLLDYIPLLSKNTWVYNYILNLVIQASTIFILSWGFYKTVNWLLKREDKKTND